MAAHTGPTDGETAVPADGPGTIRVLCVDDEPDVLELTAVYLAEISDRIEVETATSPEAGLDRLDDDIDCVVSDYDMPQRNGLEFLDAVQADRPDLPFILHTGKGSEEIASEAISAGVTDYLQKEGGKEHYERLANRVETAVVSYYARRQLRHREERFRKLIENSSDMLTILDSSGTITYISPAVERMLGYAPEELTGENAFEYIHPEDRDGVWERFVEAVENPGMTPTAEYRFKHADGSWRYIEARGRNHLDDPGIEGFVVNTRDVTERHDHEANLRKQRDFIETMLDTIPDIVYAFDPQGRPLRWNSRANEELGYSDAEIEARNVFDFVHDEDADLVTDRLGEVFKDGYSEVVARLETADGEAVPYELRARRLGNPDDEGIRGLCGIARPISDRPEQWDEIADELAFIENLFESVPDAFYAFDPEGNFLEWNEEFAEATGYSDAEIADMSPTDLVPDDERENIERSIETVLEEEQQVTVESSFETKGGEVIPYEFTGSPLESGDGDLIGVTGIGRDVTERNRRERELARQNERLSEFASVVAHDLRTPISTVRGRLELALADCDSPHLDSARETVERMDTLVEELLTLANRGETIGEADPVELSTVVDRSWQAVNPEGVTLDDALPDGTTVSADETRLLEVFENLFSNAQEHGGEAVTVGLLDDGRGFYVADDGPGIPAGERESVLDAGYSTGEEGVGFGLTIVRDITAAHGWELGVEESATGGARFEVTGVEFVD